jgi:hypothetical protein
VKRLVITARLKPDASAEAARLIAGGPPFDPAALGLNRHAVYLSHGEVVFVFEGPEVEWVVDELVGEEVHSSSFREWEGLLEEVPRLAREEYFWER